MQPLHLKAKPVVQEAALPRRFHIYRNIGIKGKLHDILHKRTPSSHSLVYWVYAEKLNDCRGWYDCLDKRGNLGELTEMWLSTHEPATCLFHISEELIQNLGVNTVGKWSRQSVSIV